MENARERYNHERMICFPIKTNSRLGTQMHYFALRPFISSKLPVSVKYALQYLQCSIA